MFLFPLHSFSGSQCINFLVHGPAEALNTVFSACFLSGRAMPYSQRLQEGAQSSATCTCWDLHIKPHPFKPLGRGVSEQVFPLRNVIFHLLTSGMEIKKEPALVDHASVVRNPIPATAEKIHSSSSFPSTLLPKLKKHFSFGMSITFAHTLLHKKVWCNERFLLSLSRISWC